MTLKLAACQTAELHPGQRGGVSKHCKPLDKTESKSWDFLPLEGLASPWGSRTFQDLRVKTKAFMTITRAANLHVGWLLSACSLVWKTGLLRAANWSLTCGVDAPPGTLPNQDSSLLSLGTSHLLFESGCRCRPNRVIHTLLCVSNTFIHPLLMTVYWN